MNFEDFCFFQEHTSFQHHRLNILLLIFHILKSYHLFVEHRRQFPGLKRYEYIKY